MNSPARNPAPSFSRNGRLRPADNFARAFAATALAQAGQFRHWAPQDVAKNLWIDDAVTEHLLTRATVNPNATPAWAALLAEQVIPDFIASLAQTSVASRLASAGLQLSSASAATVSIPRRQTLAAADVNWISESAPIPARNFALSLLETGPLRKLAAIVILTREALETPSAESLVISLLRENFALSLDAAILSNLAATDARPAGLLNGIAPLTATVGGDVAAMMADLELLAAAVTSGEAVFIMHPSDATRVRIRLQNAAALTIWGSLGCPLGTVIGIDPKAFVARFGDEPFVSASGETVVHMEDSNPAEIVTAGAVPSGAVRSAFQTDCVSVRAIFGATWGLRSAGSIAWTEAVTWA